MNVLIIGCGRVGSRLAASLAGRQETVTVLDVDGAALARLPADSPVRRVRGDATDRRALLRAGIRRADGLAAVTGSDELNAVIGRLAATMFRVPRVVARIYDPATAEIYRRLGVQTIAPVTWGAHRLAELLTFSELTPTASIGSGQVELIDVRVPALLEGHRVSELAIPGDTRIVAITRNGQTSLSVVDSSRLSAGDVVHLAASSTTRLEALLSSQ